MNTIRHLLRLALVALLTGSALADPVELKVERKVIDREDKINRPKLKAEELTTLLSIGITNKSGKDTGAVELEWSIVVARPGAKNALLSTGSKTVAEVSNATTVTVESDAVAVVKTRAGKQDMEYKVILKQAGKEIARAVSNANFDQLAAAAEPEKKAKKKKASP